MKRILVRNMLVSVDEVLIEDIDISTTVRDLIYCGYLDDDELEELTNKREHTIEYGLVTGCDMDEWTEEVGTDLDSAMFELGYAIKKCFYKRRLRKNIIMPYITILFDGYNLTSFGIGIGTEYKNLHNKYWFDLNKEEQEFLLLEIYKNEGRFEPFEDVGNAEIIFNDDLSIEVDKNSTEDNIIFLKDKVFGR